ncbi:DUF1775 domain-containing protein [Streptomyces sp. NPDC052236]|uniref:DUF1775 domain-containing protein n=1 Tax=Streptomyces sp. NPDC052236 TaxID=3365686 RepID=UPI0037CDDB54
MSRSTTARTARRLFVVTAAVLAASVALAVPASAHVEVEAEGAAALAENVTLNFTAESESGKAGITKLEVILPEGMAPADITYKEGPTGWKLALTDLGYAVSGPALATGKDAAHSVTVRQLPDAKSLAFKTLQTYSDGRLDRWIELEKSGGGHGHGHSAPILELKPAAPGAKPVSPRPTPSPSAEPTTAAPSTAAPSTPAAVDDKAGDKAGDKAAAEKSDAGSSPALPIAIGVVVLAALAGGAWWWKRRSTAGSA